MNNLIVFSASHVPPRFVVRDLRPRELYAPPIVERPLPTDSLVIDLLTGGTFGSGAHPTTQLCLTALADRVAPGAPMLDLGCGTGVLAVAAVKLGATPVVAVDIDQAALIRAQDNAVLNGVSERIQFRLGSIETVGDRAPFQVIAGNLLTSIIVELAPQLPALLAADGTLILSGVLKTQEERVRGALEDAGLRIMAAPEKSGWIALIAAHGA